MGNNFSNIGWEDYIYWQAVDKKILKKINRILEDINRNGNSGIGKPEVLKGDLSGLWSRRIDDKNRLVYRWDGEVVFIVACRGHYGDK
ncbi:MAG: Txe/YoeB family addiction module toxin [Candidatus Ancillula sp.]|jgi:toxin YoeB|nr:Txe/YoeB family addiction module toxin [Candidatus Ancillula sp.]